MCDKYHSDVLMFKNMQNVSRKILLINNLNYFFTHEFMSKVRDEKNEGRENKI